ncbi:MAG: D12 class N6 adenine-specific DNA methyltransferase [Ktedonobacterales bacterium]|jgi:DNA adenine methylase|nr:MAG: D12 class N6 adenine-specific DNA methyltransferase [Ktedonobacterales bacterium]
MRQMALFSDGQADVYADIVNVASVPQRSPFRYPGGKTWLIPRVRRWLRSRHPLSALLIEPFAGGGIVSLTAAFEKLAEHILMVELDDQVAAVWHTIIEGDADWLALQIAQFELTPEEVATALANDDPTPQAKAFRTILKNRVQRGGILAPGAGLIKYGEDGRGLASRWYPTTLKRRILDIARVRERLTFIEGDGLDVMRAFAHHDDAVFFIDPPYTAAGKRAGSRLYTCSDLDHDELFVIASTLRGNFLMTYDDAEGVRDLARKHGFDTETIAMKNTHHAKMTELLISRDLDWLRR